LHRGHRRDGTGPGELLAGHVADSKMPDQAFVTQLGKGGETVAEGAGSVRELTDAMMGPQPVHPSRGPMAAVAGAEAAGLEVVDLRQEALRMAFYDIAAVVAFLRKVLRIVPGFTVAAYRDRLAALHDFIERHGPLVAYSQRLLIEARRKR
jgi:hypothetical protein